MRWIARVVDSVAIQRTVLEVRVVSERIALSAQAKITLVRTDSRHPALGRRREDLRGRFRVHVAAGAAWIALLTRYKVQYM